MRTELSRYGSEDLHTGSSGELARSRAALFLAGGLLIVAAFQTALTFGAPFGAAAQGGTNPGQLTGALRLVSGVGAIVWLCATVIVLARGGWVLVPLRDNATRVATWGLVGLLAVGALMNFASSSPWERFGWGPFTLVLLVLCVVLARSASPRTPGGAASPPERRSTVRP